ncbi:hypothetical protein JHK86_019028 [Glycine max]|nr:hypothetical protein JHK86_019028 [Glycine max]
MPPITFMSNDFKAINPVQDDPMVISVEIANNTVKKTFVDQGSLTDILFWNIFKKMDIPESKILPHDDPLFSFAGEQMQNSLPKEKERWAKKGVGQYYKKWPS